MTETMYKCLDTKLNTKKMFSEHLKDTQLYLREVIISCMLCKRHSGRSFEVQGSFQCYTIIAYKLVHFACFADRKTEALQGRL